MNKEIAEVYVDGSIRANGKKDAFGGVGVTAYYKGKNVVNFSQLINAKTNNESEYLAVCKAIKIMDDIGVEYKIYSDSQLIVNQINGEYQIRKQELRLLYERAVFAMEVSDYYLGIEWIPREQNKKADNLAQSITKEALC